METDAGAALVKEKHKQWSGKPPHLLKKYTQRGPLAEGEYRRAEEPFDR